ncbi:MAG: MFS transporter [Acidobacteriia bacterium]|nr:MFS transporter [Terriglobia bacterium]
MGFTERLQEVKTGFQSSFWVANISELFERLAYYGQQAVLAIFLSEQLHFSQQQTGDLIGYFGFVVWFLPILGGTLADRFGFRRALASAYMILAFGYFLMGSLASPWMAPIRNSLPLYWVVLIVLMVPAMGPSVVKPCVVGTTGLAASENVRSLGYSIYYTLVNVGGMLGPIVAFTIRRSIGIENVFRVSALSVLLMFFATLFFFKEPKVGSEKKAASIAAALTNMFKVLANFRFMLFLLIFSGFWVVFWQEFIALPLFIRRYISPNGNVDLWIATDAGAVMALQIIVTYATRKIKAVPAIILGIVVSSLSWVALALHPRSHTLAAGTEKVLSWVNIHTTIDAAAPMVIIALVILALGEMIQSPRYYEYVSRLAPKGQQGTYMGYAFLPIGIGFLIGGATGGRLAHHFGDVVHQPQRMWWIISAIGFLTAALMLIYNKVIRPAESENVAS